MRIAYVDMIGGAAGDMLLAAFLDAGADRAAIERALRGLVAEGWTLAPQRVSKRGIAATYAGLTVPGEDGDPQHHHHGPTGMRSLADVIAILERSALSPLQRRRAAAVYRRLAGAEAHVHGTTAEAIHFHEVGQIDAILDVAASCVALDLLEIDELRCSAFPVGRGTVHMAHGAFPNPPPATAQLLLGWPTRAVDVEGELVTTTAAAILTTLAKHGAPDMTFERIGYGAGRSDFPFPNLTRIIVGIESDARRGGDDGAIGRDEVAVLETNLDDMLPQHFELAIERIFAAGALDVWLSSITMKKGRPAVALSAIAPLLHEEAVAKAMLGETTTLGVRARRERRWVAPRSVALVQTPYGPVRVKRSAERARAEYDDLLRIARETRLPLPEVARAVESAIASEPAP